MPALAVIPGCPIAQVGTWQTSTGEWVCTPEQLRSAVAAESSGSFRSPVIKLGHDDARFNDGEVCGDGEPAVGRLENLRLADGGQTLLADLVGVPAWLAEIMASAYPSRSIECYLDVPGQQGVTWPMVVTGLALLGVTAPAIETLGDIADLYGASRDVQDYITAAGRRVAASALPEEVPVPRAPGQVVDTPARPVAGSASIDELTTAAEAWGVTQPEMGRDVWVRDIYTDTVIFSCWMSDDVCFYRATWTETDGAFAFGPPEKVRPTYEPAPAATPDPMVASRMPSLTRAVDQRVLRLGAPVALPSDRGRAVTAGERPEETTLPISPALAELLGVDPDADEQAVEAAARAMREKADAPPPAPTDQEGGTTTTAPTPTDLDQLVAAALARELPKVTAPILASLAATSTELAEMKADKALGVKTSIIGGAVTAGKITPADRETWAQRYDDAPAVITEILASLAPGTAVPISAAGYAGGEHTGAEDDELIAAYEAMLKGGR